METFGLSDALDDFGHPVLTELEIDAMILEREEIEFAEVQSEPLMPLCTSDSIELDPLEDPPPYGLDENANFDKGAFGAVSSYSGAEPSGSPNPRAGAMEFDSETIGEENFFSYVHKPQVTRPNAPRKEKAKKRKTALHLLEQPTLFYKKNATLGLPINVVTGEIAKAKKFRLGNLEEKTEYDARTAKRRGRVSWQQVELTHDVIDAYFESRPKLHKFVVRMIAEGLGVEDDVYTLNDLRRSIARKYSKTYKANGVISYDYDIDGKRVIKKRHDKMDANHGTRRSVSMKYPFVFEALVELLKDQEKPNEKAFVTMMTVLKKRIVETLLKIALEKDVKLPGIKQIGISVQNMGKSTTELKDAFVAWCLEKGVKTKGLPKRKKKRSRKRKRKEKLGRNKRTKRDN